MQITHFGHACVLLQLETPEGVPRRMVIDPGGYSSGLRELTDVDAVLVTHEHADHLDPTHVQAIRTSSPASRIYAPTAGVAILQEHDAQAIDVSHSQQLDVAGVQVDVVTGEHAQVHPDLPSCVNNGYLIAGSVLHPGDCWVEVATSVEILLLPLGGPWMKLGEAVDYVRRARPSLVIPVHEHGLAPVHQRLHIDVLRRLAPTGTEIAVPEHARPLAL
jgi:L-ascorbate metabolism protein UlaG (beta-lactamase superfamily)